MTIYCRTETEFYDAILGLVTRGLTFKADASDLTIELLGGF